MPRYQERRIQVRGCLVAGPPGTLAPPLEWSLAGLLPDNPFCLPRSCYNEQGATGFVTFKKRLPANWQAKADAQEAAGKAEAEAADGGPLRLAFLAALALALVGAVIGEWCGRQARWRHFEVTACSCGCCQRHP